MKTGWIAPRDIADDSMSPMWKVGNQAKNAHVGV